MRFFKTNKKDESLIAYSYNQFNTNSALIKYSLIGTKKIIVPLSKIIDYSVIAIISVTTYSLLTNYYN